jgi:oligoendopeptidase F
MNEIKINEMNNQLPNWDLSEIYEDIKDPNIEKDIKEINASSYYLLTKCKGKINKLGATYFLICI